MLKVDEPTATAVEAAAFRRLVAHLRERTDVQNIDLMDLAGFCRNCLSNWLEEAAKDRGVTLARADVREHVYGMPQDEWKRLHQKEATPAQQTGFTAAHGHVSAEQAAADEGEAAIPSPS